MHSPKKFVFPLYLIIISLFFLQGTCRISLAEQPPIQVEADLMTSVEKSRSVIFTGNVDAKQGSVRIRADKMTVYYDSAPTEPAKKATAAAAPKKGQNAQQVEKIICEGNVEVTSDEWLGTSNVMHYFSKKSLVQLIGKAKAYKGQNMVQGERIDHYLDTGKSEIFGEADVAGKGQKTDEKKTGRVNMTILEQ